MKPLNRWLALVLLLGLLAWAAAMRLGGLGQRPFWRDEAWVACSVRDLTYRELIGQTDTPIPPLFGVVTKFIGARVHPPELGWRLLPAAAGIGTVLLVFRAARRLRAPRTLALAATSLAAGSLLLAVWSRELKHYSLEAFCSPALAVLVLGLRAETARWAAWWRAIAVALLVMLLPWLAYGSVFPIVTLLLLLLIVRPARGVSRWRTSGVAVLGLLLFAASFLAVWISVGSAQASQPELARYMDRWRFQPLSPLHWMTIGSRGVASTVMLLFPVAELGNVAHDLGLLWLTFLAGGVWTLAAVGLVTWPRQTRRLLAVWLFGPLLIQALVSLAVGYPCGLPRMEQFWAPPMLIALAAGLALVLRTLARGAGGRAAWGLLATLPIALLPALYVIQLPCRNAYFVHHDFPAVLNALEARRLAKDPVFIGHFATPCTQFYAPRLRPPVVRMPTVAGTLPAPQSDPVQEILALARQAQDRFWIVDTIEPRNPEDRPVLQAARAAGFKVESVLRAGGDPSSYGAAELLVATRP